MIKISDLLREMQSFVNVDGDVLEKADKSNISTDTSEEFADLLDGWEAGVYDEDPNNLVTELTNLLDAK